MVYNSYFKRYRELIVILFIDKACLNGEMVLSVTDNVLQDQRKRIRT